MRLTLRLVIFTVSILLPLGLSAITYKADRLRKAVDVTGLQNLPDTLLPSAVIEMPTKDGRNIILRTDNTGAVEHVGIPLFSETMRLLQPSPVYDFLEYAVLNKEYKVDENQLYLSKVIFKTGSWNTLLKGNLEQCECSIENREDKLYIVTWQRNGSNVAVIGIPIEYELLNNDTRRNMERDFIKGLSAFTLDGQRNTPAEVSEDELSIYGTEGLFVIPGESYIIDLLNQNVYYKLTTISETARTIINNKPMVVSVESVQPVIVIDNEFPAETFANLMMCDDSSVPDVTVDLDFHLSNYHRERVSMPLSRLKAYCCQQGCGMYFACDGTRGEKVRGVMFASNVPKGYNHLFSIRIPAEQLTSETPVVQADVYLYIPPIDKEKLFGTAPTKKSGVKFKLP